MTIKDCCKLPGNLIPKQERSDLVVNTCKVCGCRHFNLKADPGKLGAILKPLGK